MQPSEFDFLYVSQGEVGGEKERERAASRLRREPSWPARGSEAPSRCEWARDKLTARTYATWRRRASPSALAPCAHHVALRATRPAGEAWVGEDAGDG